MTRTDKDLPEPSTSGLVCPTPPSSSSSSSRRPRLPPRDHRHRHLVALFLAALFVLIVVLLVVLDPVLFLVPPPQPRVLLSTGARIRADPAAGERVAVRTGLPRAARRE
ncbi:hypothetical protein QYE76_007953 [Lolium multiflorum]|uniref:Uncharacterized protein n=1 Tax=Lolium multiflorum TaxID=4521 RepID=A0AAD8VC04_LOLMU|nr:hypothetical protein QYE76_007953 [Lolium multiflorum]